MVQILGVIATIVALLSLELVNGKLSESISGQSARWEAHVKELHRKRRAAGGAVSEWQESGSCTLTNFTAHDALQRRTSNLLATPGDQGSCGSCWAFAAAHAYTDTLSISNQARRELISAEHLTRCIEEPNDSIYNGCCGGNAIKAVNFIQENGIVSESCLPYSSTLQGYFHITFFPDRLYKYFFPLHCPATCSSTSEFDTESVPAPTYEYSTNEMQVMEWLQQGGAVFAAMQVANRAFMHYGCGVFCDLPIETPDHGVEIVDYSLPSFPGTPYWVVKNSWGTEWGENGYFRIARNNNQLNYFFLITPQEIRQRRQAPPPPAPPPLLCAAERVTSAAENELIMSAVEFGIGELNNRNLVSCPEGSGQVMLDSVVNATIQIVEGAIANITVIGTINDCPSSAIIDLLVEINLNNTFTLLSYDTEFVDNSAMIINVPGVTMLLLVSFLLICLNF